MEFPKLDPDLYSTASAHTVSGWDSIAQLSLLTLIAEEFQREIDFEEFEGATSFEALAAALQDQNSAAPESKKNTSSSDN